MRAVCESFHGSKDAGFKVVAHMMPDLPNVGLERDIEQFIEFFENPVMTTVVLFACKLRPKVALHIFCFKAISLHLLPCSLFVLTG